MPRKFASDDAKRQASLAQQDVDIPMVASLDKGLSVFDNYTWLDFANAALRRALGL